MQRRYVRRASRGGAERQAPQARDPEDQGKASEREGLWRLAGLELRKFATSNKCPEGHAYIALGPNLWKCKGGQHTLAIKL